MKKQRRVRFTVNRMLALLFFYSLYSTVFWYAL